MAFLAIFLRQNAQGALAVYSDISLDARVINPTDKKQLRLGIGVIQVRRGYNFIQTCNGDALIFTSLDLGSVLQTAVVPTRARNYVC